VPPSDWLPEIVPPLRRPSPAQSIVAAGACGRILVDGMLLERQEWSWYCATLEFVAEIYLSLNQHL
jgi:hypothetical protein